MCSWCDKFIVLQTLNRQVKTYTTYICGTKCSKCSNLAEVRWPLWYTLVWCPRSFFIVYKNLLANVIQGFPYWGDGGVPPTTKNLLPSKVDSTQWKNKNITFSWSHCPCTIFVLIPNSFKTHIMLILILIDVQYSQNAVFSFEKFWNRQNHSSSGSHHLVKKSPQS